MSPSSTQWPERPYKGLSHYGPKDTAIFAGRDRDVSACARRIAGPKTRILLLHGLTASGKTSFLRAGLIPFMERTENAFQFPRSSEHRDAEVLFVRSTGAPLFTLADSIHDIASRLFEVHTPIGIETVSAQGALLGHIDRSEFRVDVGNNPARMVSALQCLAEVFPRTFVLVIDQAEEVLTLRSEQSAAAANAFFDFLSLLSSSSFDMRILLALRTEYFGRFVDELRRREVDRKAIADYLLQDLSTEHIVEVMVRPTLATPVESYGISYGIPFHHYGFVFEAGLAERIASDIRTASPTGGVLPVLQIACERLYAKTKEAAGAETTWVISSDDYDTFGRIADQINDYIEGALVRICGLAKVAPGDLRAEVTRWRHVLAFLCQAQPDGSITTKICTDVDLRREMKDRQCLLSPDQVVDELCADSCRILRRVSVPSRVESTVIACYSLGHDVIGVALRDWAAREETTAFRTQVWSEAISAASPSLYRTPGQLRTELARLLQLVDSGNVPNDRHVLAQAIVDLTVARTSILIWAQPVSRLTNWLNVGLVATMAAATFKSHLPLSMLLVSGVIIGVIVGVSAWTRRWLDVGELYESLILALRTLAERVPRAEAIRIDAPQRAGNREEVPLEVGTAPIDVHTSMPDALASSDGPLGGSPSGKLLGNVSGFRT